MLYSFYAQARLLERETVVFCAGTCLCNISHEFLCLPHCCRFLQYPPTSLKKKGERGAKKINHCTDCCKTSEWIWAIFFFFFFLRECVCERNASAPPTVRSLYAEWVFFAFVFFVWLYTNYWQQEFWWKSHGDSTMHVTASRNHSGQTNSSQPLASAGSYTEVTSLTFIHGRPLNTVVL